MESMTNRTAAGFIVDCCIALNTRRNELETAFSRSVGRGVGLPSPLAPPCDTAALLPSVDAFNVYIPAKDEQVTTRLIDTDASRSLVLVLTACSLVRLRLARCLIQCFFDHVSKNDKVVGSYWVAEGGNLDIDLKVTGPDGKVVYEKERTQDGSFQFNPCRRDSINGAAIIACRP
jgi:hypothetical protein